MIRFNVPLCLGDELIEVQNAIDSLQLSGGGEYCRKCESLLESYFAAPKALLTPSCTAALEMAAILLDVKSGDEVIMPSFTFVSTANAFLLRGARVVFVDIDPKTLNISVDAIKNAITKRTKVIVPVHYGGFSCDMEALMILAKDKDIAVVEDAAQALGSSFNGKPLGSYGDFSTISFHETKNFTSGGEGGALLINNPKYLDRAHVIQEKGTNRKNFHIGIVDKYSWVDIGSSFLMSEIQAAYLYPQLCSIEMVNSKRMTLREAYVNNLAPLVDKGIVRFQEKLDASEGNAHNFCLILPNEQSRNNFISFMHDAGVKTVFHYLPLHSSQFGLEHCMFKGKDRVTSDVSKTLVRLPLYYSLTGSDVNYICEQVLRFFKSEKNGR